MVKKINLIRQSTVLVSIPQSKVIQIYPESEVIIRVPRQKQIKLISFTYQPLNSFLKHQL